MNRITNSIRVGVVQYPVHPATAFRAVKRHIHTTSRKDLPLSKVVEKAIDKVILNPLLSKIKRLIKDSPLIKTWATKIAHFQIKMELRLVPTLFIILRVSAR